MARDSPLPGSTMGGFYALAKKPIGKLAKKLGRASPTQGVGGEEEGSQRVEMRKPRGTKHAADVPAEAGGRAGGRAGAKAAAEAPGVVTVRFLIRATGDANKLAEGRIEVVVSDAAKVRAQPEAPPHHEESMPEVSEMVAEAAKAVAVDAVAAEAMAELEEAVLAPQVTAEAAEAAAAAAEAAEDPMTEAGFESAADEAFSLKRKPLLKQVSRFAFAAAAIKACATPHVNAQVSVGDSGALSMQWEVEEPVPVA